MHRLTRMHIALVVLAPVYALLCHYIYTHVAATSNTVYVVLVSVLSFLYLVGAVIAILSLIVTLAARALADLVIVITYSLYSLSVLKQATSLSLAGILTALVFLAGFSSFLYGVIDTGKMLFTATRRRRQSPPFIRT